MNKPVVRKLRCAVYTRKSSEEGLEQEFNSLHAQREACESYIASQRSEGWVLVRDQYDDGGISGGTLERPGLKRLLKPTPDRLKGLRGTNQDIFDSLVLGTTITKSIDGDSKSYSFRFIDWENPSNNAFHVTAEFSVERTGSSQTRATPPHGWQPSH